ncbi:MAG: DUF1819 family protein [Desulfobulbaceae bacterium]|nr:DUF1819 family protein [Desulfobulbaceae bacterium]
MTDSKYKMSFTSGGLFFNESLQVAELFNEIGDWQKTRDHVLLDNFLQARTESSAKRRAREICFRLELLTDAQLQLLISGSRHEQQYLLWVAVCKRYSFVHEFMMEVVREKYLRMDLHLHYQDYEIFFADKAEWHEELEHLRDSTRAKLRQVLFKIMRESEILSPDNMIIPGLLTEQLTKVLTADHPALLALFPVSDMDINSWLA